MLTQTPNMIVMLWEKASLEAQELQQQPTLQIEVGWTARHIADIHAPVTYDDAFQRHVLYFLSLISSTVGSTTFSVPVSVLGQICEP